MLGALTDLLWPRACPACGRASDRAGRHLCSRCFAALPFDEGPARCRSCGRAFPAAAGDGPDAFVCQACRDDPPEWDWCRSALRYAAPVDNLVKSFKFGGAVHLAADFAELLEGALRLRDDAAEIDAVLPVPLHPARLSERGYNQSELLSARVAAILSRRHDARSLVRRNDTEHQARLGGRARRENLRGAFAVVRPEWVRGRTLLLVDDVTTTGSTLRECARVLLKAGVWRVRCLTLARA